MKIVRPSTAVAEFLEASGVGQNSPDAIHSLAMVGALSMHEIYVGDPMPPGPMELSERDDDYLIRTLSLFKEQGIPFGNMMDIRAYNRLYDREGGDFLKNATLKADAIVFCYLYWHTGDVEHKPGPRGQSELAHERTLWHQRLQSSQAKVAVNITAEYRELPTSFIRQDPFKLVCKQAFNTNAQHDKQLHLLMHRDWAPAAHLISAPV